MKPKQTRQQRREEQRDTASSLPEFTQWLKGQLQQIMWRQEVLKEALLLHGVTPEVMKQAETNVINRVRPGVK
jgi:DnaJ-domain-containing protein 1